MGQREESPEAATAEIVGVGLDLAGCLLDIEDIVADLDHVVEPAVDGLADDFVVIRVAG